MRKKSKHTSSGVIVTLLVSILLCISGCSTKNNENNSETPKINVTPQPTQQESAVPNGPIGGEMGPGAMNGEMGGGLGGKDMDTSSITNKYLDIKYGSLSDTQTLDIYLPEEGEGPYPVIVAIHGGAFLLGSKTGGDLQPMVEGVKHGYAVACVNYRLSNEAIFPAAISDVKAAIRFLRANADQYKLDGKRMAAWGDSAGANLAALVGTSGDVDTLNGENKENLEYSSAVQAVVDWFGPIDFLAMDEQFVAAGITPKMGKTGTDTSPESKYIGGNITENVEQTKKASPATYVTKNDPPFLIQHGNKDSNVPLQQSIDFSEQLKAAIGENKVTFTIIDGASHGGEQFETEENLKIVFDFLNTVLAK